MESPKALTLEQTLAELEASEPAFFFEKMGIETELETKSAVYTGLGIKILSVFGGFIGTVFFLGFLGMAIMDSAGGSLVFGSVFIAGALFVHKISKSILLDTSTVCVYLAGFALIAIGLDKLKTDENFIIGVVSVISLAGLFLSRSFVLSFLSAIIFNGSLIALLENNKAPNLTHVLLMYVTAVFVLLTLFEHTLISSKSLLSGIYNPLRSAFLFSLIAVLALYTQPLAYQSIIYPYISSLFLIAAILVLLNLVFNSLGIAKPQTKAVYFLVSLVIFAPMLFAPAILGALLIILVSFQFGHRTGFAMGIAALIYFVSRYYYDLSYTLLVKSEMLMLSGALFIAAFLLVRKRLSAPVSHLKSDI